MNTQIQQANADIQIYVVDLAAEKAGTHRGLWLDALECADELQQQIDIFLKASSASDADEYAIKDYDGFEGCTLYESDSLELVHNKAEFINKHGEVGARLLAHVADNIDDAQRLMNDCYQGEYKSLSTYAQNLTGKTTDRIPENIARYIDYEAMADDIESSGDIFTIRTACNAIHVFWNQ